MGILKEAAKAVLRATVSAAIKHQAGIRVTKENQAEYLAKEIPSRIVVRQIGNAVRKKLDKK